MKEYIPLVECTHEVGDKVRSYDFPSLCELEAAADCYIEGTIEGFERLEGCMRYKIKVEKKVFAGEVITDDPRKYVYPPVNGTKQMFSKLPTMVVQKVA